VRSGQLIRAARAAPSVLALLYGSGLYGVAQALLGNVTTPKMAQLALRFPNERKEPPEEQWHIDGMKKHHLSPFNLLVGVALSAQPAQDMGNLAVWPGCHVVVHEAVGRARARQGEDAMAVEVAGDGSVQQATAAVEEEADEDEDTEEDGDAWRGERPVLGPNACAQLLLEPGDAVLLHQRLPHRVSPNHSPHVRYMAYFRLSNVEHRPNAPVGGLRDLDSAEEIFKSSLKRVDVTFQNLDSSEISLTDVSHYFDSDPTKVVSGLRADGKKPTAFVADTTTANAQVRTLSETVRLDARTKLLNPKFYEGMLKSGYEGTREITKRLRNTMGWSATAGAVDNFVYEDANDTFIKDEEMQKRLLETNPNAFRDMVTTFLEANGRGYWDTSEENLDRLRELYAEVDDKIEGI